MDKYSRVANLVKEVYENSEQWFGQWMWKHHVPVVAKKTEELSERFGANLDIAVAGAWLHDFGDAFVHRNSKEHPLVTEEKSKKVLEKAGYSTEEIKKVLEEVIAPHSCRDDFIPTTIEGKVMASADALAHFMTDFFVHFTWMHLPENKTFEEYRDWVAKKIDHDFHKKIFFDEVREEVRDRVATLKEVFGEK
ncbi:MAG: HD domain-containing protein [Pseudomonadales bacterium]|nr:HD domain-containing protein [Pseudomonadales bacterium]